MTHQLVGTYCLNLADATLLIVGISTLTDSFFDLGLNKERVGQFPCGLLLDRKYFIQTSKCY